MSFVWFPRSSLYAVLLGLGLATGTFVSTGDAADRVEGPVDAEAARDFLKRFVNGQRLRLEDVRNDKYGGRVIAEVRNTEGEDVGEALLTRRLARAYEGGRRGNWCPARSGKFNRL